MKKGILIVIIVGMLGWAIFDFFGSSRERADEGNITSSDSITSLPPDDTNSNSDEVVVESDEIGLESGKIAPDFEVTTLDGEQAKLSDFRCGRVMLNFWATWCPPCRAEMPDMQKVYDEEDVTILAVNMIGTESGEDVVVEFIDDFELTFPILMDETSDIMNTYEIQAYPTTYMIDSNGRIQFVALGAMNHEQMLQFLSDME